MMLDAITSPTLTPAPLAADRTTYDVAIVGGGIIGLTLACALQSSGCTVAVIEAQAPAIAAARPQAYAMSLVSARILAGIGIWPEIVAQITRFAAVQLTDGDQHPGVRFKPADIAAEAVYFAAEHGVLMRALQAAVQRSPQIDYWCPARVQQVTTHPHQVEIQVEQDDRPVTLQAQLLVAADGARSPLRQQAGIPTLGWRYWQSCLTVTVQPARSHANIAYEKFQPSGPFAILPLSGNRCQVVWTAPHAEAIALQQLPPADFLAELEHRYGRQMGRLTVVTEPRLFPVQLMQSRQYVQARLALIGDAAHCCHPVGGQGMNMGIRDAAALAQVIQTAMSRGQDIGSLTVLRRYQRWRQWENLVILTFTDILDRVFSNQWWPLVGVRRCGLLLLRRVPPLRSLALRLMTGLFGTVPSVGRSRLPLD